MGSVRNRVVALEVRVGAKVDAVHNAAYARIFTALRKGLPVVHATNHAVDRCTNDTSATNCPGVSFEELIASMCQRIEASALTVDDQRMLAALPAEELQMTGNSPESVVSLFGNLFSEY
jgi:hypothetical protein